MTVKSNDQPAFGRIGTTIATTVVGGVLLAVLLNAVRTPSETADAARDASLIAASSADRLGREITDFREQVADLRAAVTSIQVGNTQRFERNEETISQFRQYMGAGERFTADDYEREDRRLTEKFEAIDKRLEWLEQTYVDDLKELR